MKAVAAAFNQEKALVGAFSVITNLRMELFEALVQLNQLSPALQCITAATTLLSGDPVTDYWSPIHCRLATVHIILSSGGVQENVLQYYLVFSININMMLPKDQFWYLWPVSVSVANIGKTSTNYL